MTHNSFQVGTENDASRGQKTVTSAGGERPAPLVEVAGPQAAVTVGYVSAAVPLPATPMLSGDVGADNPADANTCLILLAKEKAKEEEQRRAENQAKARAYLEEWSLPSTRLSTSL